MANFLVSCWIILHPSFLQTVSLPPLTFPFPSPSALPERLTTRSFSRSSSFSFPGATNLPSLLHTAVLRAHTGSCLLLPSLSFQIFSLWDHFEPFGSTLVTPSPTNTNFPDCQLLWLLSSSQMPLAWATWLLHSQLVLRLCHHRALAIISQSCSKPSHGFSLPFG